MRSLVFMRNQLVRHNFNQHQRGYTLLETVFVVAVIGVLLGLAVPRYQGYLADRALQNAAYLIQADLRLAQQSAMARAGAGPRVEICFAPTGYDIYTVDYTSPVDRTGAQVGRVIKVVPAGQAYRSGIAITIDPTATDACLRDASLQAIVFASGGAPISFDDPTRKVMTLTLNGRVNRLTTYPETGRVIVCGDQPQC